MSRSLPRKPLTLVVVLLSIGAWGAASGDAVRAVFTGVVAVLIAWVTRGPSPKMPPRWVVNGLVLLALLNAVRVALERRVGVDEFSEFLLWVLLIKLLDRRRARDEAQLLSLSVFLAFGAILTSNSLATGLVLLVMLPVLAAAVMRYQLAVGAERAQAVRQKVAPAGITPPPVAPVSGRRAGRHIGVLTVTLTLASLLLSAGVFVVMPRGIGVENFGRWGNAGVGRVTGFTSTVDIGLGGLISESQTPVLDLTVTDYNRGVRLGGDGEVYYLRGAVLDTYTGRSWIVAESPNTRPTPLPQRPPGAGADLGIGGVERDLRLNVTLRNVSPGPNYLFTVWRPLRVTFFDSGREIVDVQTGTVMREGQGGKFRYEVECGLPPFPTWQTARVYSRPVFEHAELHEITRRVLSEGGIELDENGWCPQDRMREAAMVLRTHLRTHYTYTLDAPPPPARRDPIAWFLAESRAGHCEYFASAMAAMCRSVGINSRVITGYVAVEFHAATGHYIVRESNAHAWVEVEEAPGFWRSHDPTAPADLRRHHAPAPGLFARVARLLDAVEYAWITSVVGFDSTTRSSLLGWGDSPESEEGGFYETVAGGIRSADWRWWGRVIVNGIVAGATVLVVGLALIAVGRRVRAARDARQRHGVRIDDPAVRARVQQADFYTEAVSLLAAAGLGKPDHRPPVLHARELSRTDSALGSAFDVLADLFYILRFGGRDLTGEERSRAASALGRLRDRVGASAGSGRGYQSSRDR